jgi:hypothetical protein
MQQISESENIPFDKLAFKDFDNGREGMDKSPIPSFFTSPINFANSKRTYGSPQMQSRMLSLSGMNSSRFNQIMGSPVNIGTPLDFSSLMNANSYQAFFPCENLSPWLFTTNGGQPSDSFYKIEDKE